MNEVAIDSPAGTERTTKARAVTQPQKFTAATYGYSLLFLVIAAGWMLRGKQFVDPGSGTGYWLGIIGASLMIALLAYPLRKRIRVLHKLGATKHWFRMHMIFGLVGPALILFHCNFKLGSFNSRVALYCMLMVAGSGIVGRHFYAKIHRGLYGRKTNLKELRDDLVAATKRSHGMAKLMPGLVAKLDAHSRELQGSEVTRTLGIGRSLRWSLTHRLVHYSLLLTARKELKEAAKKSVAVSKNYKRLLRFASANIRDYTAHFGRVAQFSFYERLFSLWHIFHLPIFLMMVLSALMHVLAVHMY